MYLPKKMILNVDSSSVITHRRIVLYVSNKFVHSTYILSSTTIHSRSLHLNSKDHDYPLFIFEFGFIPTSIIKKKLKTLKSQETIKFQKFLIIKTYL